MTTRRDFLKSAVKMGALAGLGGHAEFNRCFAAPGDERKTLRTITYNVYAAKGWSRQKYDSKEMDKPATPEHMKEMAKKFADTLQAYDADLITFPESPLREVIEAIAGHMKMNHVFFPSGENWPGALFTRFEIESSKNAPLVEGERPKDLFTRHWGKAVLRAPQGPITVHSIHLHPSDDAIRAREVTEVVKALKADMAAGQTIILQGDFNHSPDRPEYPRWKEAGLIDIFEKVGTGPALTIPADAPTARIDFVWTTPELARHAKEARVLVEPPFRGEKPDDPASLSLSDHMPVMATFE